LFVLTFGIDLRVRNLMTPVLLMTGLRPYTWYNIYMQPFHGSVRGVLSTIVRERTKEAGMSTLLFTTDLLSRVFLKTVFKTVNLVLI